MMHAATLFTFIAIPLASVAASGIYDHLHSRDASFYDNFDDDLDLSLNSRQEYELDTRDWTLEEDELIGRDDFLNDLSDAFDLHLRSEPELEQYHYRRYILDSFSKLKRNQQSSPSSSSHAIRNQRRGLLNKIGTKVSGIGSPSKQSNSKLDPQLAARIEREYQLMLHEFEAPNLDMSLFITNFSAVHRAVDKWGCASKSKASDVAAACVKWGPLHDRVVAAYKHWIHN